MNKIILMFVPLFITPFFLPPAPSLIFLNFIDITITPLSISSNITAIIGLLLLRHCALLLVGSTFFIGRTSRSLNHFLISARERTFRSLLQFLHTFSPLVDGLSGTGGGVFRSVLHGLFGTGGGF